MMDTPQRWQVASLVTAVAGLSAGAVMMTRTTTEPAPTIRLDVVAAANQQPEGPGALSERLPEIVRPALIEDDGSFSAASTPTTSPDDEPSATSAASVAEPASAQSIDSPEDATSSSITTQGATSSSTPAPAPAPAESADSPDSVASPESVDSD